METLEAGLSNNNSPGGMNKPQKKDTRKRKDTGKNKAFSNISAARAVYWEFFIVCSYKKFSFEVRDLFKKARGPRGVIFPKYEPVATPKVPEIPKFDIL